MEEARWEIRMTTNNGEWKEGRWLYKDVVKYGIDVSAGLTLMDDNTQFLFRDSKVLVDSSFGPTIQARINVVVEDQNKEEETPRVSGSLEEKGLTNRNASDNNQAMSKGLTQMQIEFRKIRGTNNGPRSITLQDHRETLEVAEEIRLALRMGCYN
ncbi:hypothetical protein PIB30_102771 [Stylosanthes scabra]|uniref:Uncharacterized protein n=1 Tax=Stylosanthes scabra TaxID=79078 RepID=A0ABU6VZ24_9FABA|nr:hypothetical protein [Stylosanthes scabra]